MKQKSLFWALLFAAAVLVCGAVLLLRGGGPAAFACVYVDGGLYARYDLNAVVIPYEVTVETEYGHNTLRISHGAVQVAEADCPEQVCVNQGDITDGLIPIACLPHHLVITIEDGS